MSLTIRMSESEKRLVRSYAKDEGLSLSEAVRRTIFDAIEDKYDSMIGDEALEEHERNPDAISWEEFEKELDGKERE